MAEAIDGEAGRNPGSGSAHVDRPLPLRLRRAIDPAPQDLEEIAAWVLEIDRLAERAMLGMIDRSLERDIVAVQIFHQGLEAVARHREGVANAQRSAVLVLGRHRHVVGGDHHREKVILDDDSLVNRPAMKRVLGSWFR